MTDEGKKNWTDANTYCSQTYETSLAIIETDEDANNILSTLKNSDQPEEDMWIGLNDINNEGVWTWIDGTPCNGGNCIDLSYWVDGEPATGSFGNQYNCGQIGGQKHNIFDMLDDYRCPSKRYFLCEDPGIYTQCTITILFY